MSFMNDVLRVEMVRTGNYGMDITDEEDVPCPICGSTSYNYLIRGYDIDIVGCEVCCKKIYRGDE